MHPDFLLDIWDILFNLVLKEKDDDQEDCWLSLYCVTANEFPLSLAAKKKKNVSIRCLGIVGLDLDGKNIYVFG
jgi:hypothetical protein